MKAELAALGTLLLVSCGPQDTGGQLVSFHAYARGSADVSGSRELDNGSGFHVQLTSARMYIGALYLRLGRTNPGSADSSCVGDTTYGIQVPGPGDIDVLSASPQELAVLGSGTTDLDQSAEIWLGDGDITSVASNRVVASVAGVATKGGTSRRFSGSITIGQNRVVPPSNPAQPGQNPICKQRIISPIPVNVRPTVGGDLMLRVDPTAWLRDVDFSLLVPNADGTYEIPDASTGSGADVTAARSFFTGVTGAAASTYDFSWFVP